LKEDIPLRLGSYITGWWNSGKAKKSVFFGELFNKAAFANTPSPPDNYQASTAFVQQEVQLF
jgi:hypothetical protein